MFRIQRLALGLHVAFIVIFAVLASGAAAETTNADNGLPTIQLVKTGPPIGKA